MTNGNIGDVDALWVADVTAWQQALIGAGRSPGTVQLRVYHLGRMGAWAAARGTGLLELELDQLNEYLSGYRSWSRSTRRSHISSMHSFYRWALISRRIVEDPTIHLPRVRPTPPRPNPVPDDGYRAALAKARPRERLMVRLAGEHGLRRGEISRVHSDDIVEEIDGSSLIVHGKGGKIRVVPLTALALAELRQLPAGWAFPGQIDGHLSARWVGRLLKRLLPPGFTGHKLRHRAASEWYAVDHDLLTVQDLLGHASPSTTRDYIALPDTAKRRLVNAAAAGSTRQTVGSQMPP